MNKDKLDDTRILSLREKFKIPKCYIFASESYGEVTFTYCDSAIEVNLRENTAVESHMGCDLETGHYFTPWTKWPKEDQ